MIIDCIADLHGYYPKLEGGDLLIVAGDLTASNLEKQYMDYLYWTCNLPYKKVIFISGNHDMLLQREDWHDFYSKIANGDKMAYLCDSGIEFEGLKIWGSPWTKIFERMNPKCKAFTCDTEEELYKKFSLIPEDTDILITHGPPFTILDKTKDGRQVGSVSLMAHHIGKVRPKLFVWGHIHEAYGIESGYSWNKTKYVNCSHVNELYQPVNRPIRIVL